MRNDKDNLIVNLTFEFALKSLLIQKRFVKLTVLKWLLKFSGVGHQLALIYEKHKMQKVKPILSTNSKLLPKKQMKLNIGSTCVKNLNFTPIQMKNYSKKYNL
jgi:hypothetical protein